MGAFKSFWVTKTDAGFEYRAPLLIVFFRDYSVSLAVLYSWANPLPYTLRFFVRD